MKVLEKLSLSKTPNQDHCEDGIFVSDHYVAVVDGATSKSKKEWDGKKTGRLAREIILSQISKLDPRLDAPQCMLTLDQALADWYSSKKILKNMADNPVDRFVASIAVYSRAHHQIWLLSDCQAMVDGSLFTNNQFFDEITTNARSLFLESELLKGKTIKDLLKKDTGREFILPLLEIQNSFQNVTSQSDFSHAALDGFFTDTSAIKIIKLPKNSKEIVLASDGYPVLAPTLKESEKNLQKILQEDPLLFRQHKSTKGLRQGNVSFDDRSYVRVSV